jgi:ubiquinone/menaquinone biosynthesis C-methylase UbiE
MRRTHTCPWWFGYSFDNPLRRLVHDPAAILGGLVGPGHTAVDIGCGLGYFTLGMAELVGDTGRVVALDVQSSMVHRARRRVTRRGLAERVEFRVCAPERLGFAGPADFALAFWMVHEVSHPEAFLSEVRSFLGPSGRFLIVEPRVHVPRARFAETVELARQAGFEVGPGPRVRFSRAVVCTA